MKIAMFNGWYFLWVAISVGGVIGLYFALKNKKDKTKKIVLFSFLALGFILHFLKMYIPPYSVDEARLLRDSWFVNICGANIALFPFIFLLKSKKAKDYMFFIGVLSGVIAILYPTEPMDKTNQLGEFWDIVRFYYHHWMLMAVPLLMVLLKIHTVSYKRVLWAPTGLMLVMLFIMLNQILQSEIGFIPLRGGNFFDINYKNTSWIWGPHGAIGDVLRVLCPNFFKVIPVGEFAGQQKFWPWFWLIFPVYILATPLSFGLAMIFDHKNFKTDVKNLKERVNAKIQKLKESK